MNFLWTDGTSDFFFGKPVSETLPIETVHAPSSFASLDGWFAARRIGGLYKTSTHLFKKTVALAVHRYEEFIGGRSYLIEVKAVDHDRWRAYIVRIPGMPTALMPFYGGTPAEAAKHLSDWLTRAHERVPKPAGSA